MRIGFCFNYLHDDGKGAKSELDFDTPENINRIQQVIESLGHSVIRIEADENVFEKLKREKDNIDLVFNIAEGKHGNAREAWVPLMCEILRIPYTHSNPTTHAIKLDKKLAKLAVAGMGIAVPGNTNFPKIIKPNAEGSSMGVFDANVVNNEKELKNRIEELRKMGVKGELLEEEYIEGREFTVALLGNEESLEVLPIIEQKFDFLPVGMKPIAGYELKWLTEDKLDDLKKAYDCPAKIDRELRIEIEETSKKIYNGLGVRDCARIDYRCDSRGKLYFLEINTLPGINLDETVISYLPLAARTAGINGQELIGRIINEAAKRAGIMGK